MMKIFTLSRNKKVKKWFLPVLQIFSLSQKKFKENESFGLHKNGTLKKAV